MAFTGNEDHYISLAQAAAWTKNYRDSLGTTGGTIAHYFGQQAINDILGQDGCVGMRIYYALDDDGQKQLILVGTDANENDLYEGKLAERSIKCPQSCGAANPLNSNVTS